MRIPYSTLNNCHIYATSPVAHYDVESQHMAVEGCTILNGIYAELWEAIMKDEALSKRVFQLAEMELEKNG